MAKRKPKPWTRLQIMAMYGDYQLAHQPYWNQDFDDLDEAVKYADITWRWMRGEDNVGYDLPVGYEYPLGSPETSHGEFDRSCALCVFVFDPDNDELVERPLYVRGNPACDVEE